MSTTACHLPYSEPDESSPRCPIVCPFMSSKLVPIFLSLVPQHSSTAEIVCSITGYVDFLRWDISAHRPPSSCMTTIYQLSVTVYSIHSQLLSMFGCRLLHRQTEDTPWCPYRDPLNKAHLWLTCWLYGPQRALASLITDAHSSLPTAFSRHLLTFISCRSFSTSSSHLNLGIFFYLWLIFVNIR